MNKMLILSKPTATKDQVMQFIKNTRTAHSLCYAIVPMIYDEAIKVGINPIVAVAQALKETGYFNYNGVLRPNFCNICGLKGSYGGGDYDPNAHKRFEYWEDGVKAFIDHLALYCGVKGYPKYSKETELYYNGKGTFYDVNKYKKNGTTLDPRHFTYLLGTVKTVEDLSGKWCPSKTYGEDIIAIVRKIEGTKVSVNSEINENKIINLAKEIISEIEGK